MDEDLLELLESWVRSMHDKSAATRATYSGGVRAFLRWCEQTGAKPSLDRATVSDWVAAMSAENEPATAHHRLKALRRFSAWLAAEGETDADLIAGMAAPKIPAKVTPALTDEQLRALIRQCAGTGLRDRRDEAIVRLMAETGIRAGECLALAVPDVDLNAGLVTIRRGKGGRGRVVPISPQTVAALDRYLRARRRHRLAGSPALWVGAQDKTYGYNGLRDGLRERAKAAGISGFHPHLLRHTAATRWLRAGGSEGGLMAVAGWSSRTMLDRYTAASASERAAAEARGLNLGEI